ncbi:MAG: hypothetical protein DSY70_06340 [Desulfobulbus sp.]|nr:MAG: hypothetical protein DSY70_06340 [Desulfobulbus sp.]
MKRYTQKKKQMNTICPSWSLSTRSCRLSNDGLYLPVAEHVGMYCEGGGYLSCPQSINFNSLSGPTSKHREERRCSRRTPVRLFARVTERFEEMNQAGEGAAVTVDVSPEGLRVELCRPLAEGVEILFSLEHGPSNSPVHGIGRVQWCRSMENASLFHAGIKVTDPAIGSVMQTTMAELSE